MNRLTAYAMGGSHCFRDACIDDHISNPVIHEELEEVLRRLGRRKT